jgi:predicted small lipoprotein YifL
MKKIISVYIIFAFLLTSFAGCGKLKNIVGLSQPEAPIPPKVDNQLDTSASSEVDSQLDTSASSEVNSQSDTSASSEVDSQPDTSNSLEVNSQSEASSEIDVKDLMKKESWKEWACRQWNDNKWKWIGGVAVVVGTGSVCCYRYRCRLRDEHLHIPPNVPPSAKEFLALSGEYVRLMDERRRLLAEIPPREDAIYAVDLELISVLDKMYAIAYPRPST